MPAGSRRQRPGQLLAPRHYKKACATRLRTACREECTLAASPTCTDECTVSCTSECDRGVSITCIHNCFGECVGSCSATCDGASDPSQCRRHLRGHVQWRVRHPAALSCNGEYALAGDDLQTCVQALIEKGTLDASAARATRAISCSARPFPPP